MIASFYPYGRLGNRLFTFSNLIAFAELKKVPLMVPAFSKYRKDFPFFQGNRACKYKVGASEGTFESSPFLIAISAKAGLIPTVRFWEERHVFFDAEDADDPRVHALVESPRIVFEGWNFRSRQAIVNSRQTIKQVFKPSEKIETTVKHRIAAGRTLADVLIGVHVRWDDYRGSERFFDKSEYTCRMLEVLDLSSACQSRISSVLFRTS